MDAAHPRDPGTALMRVAWALSVPLEPGELFSTWLARAALRQGCDPLCLTGDVWPKWRAWTLDIDRGLRADRMLALAQRSGVDAARLEEACLRPVALAINGSAPANASRWPWVLALGSRNRMRCGGLQYCPACLADDRQPYFRRAWRLAWHVGCVEHCALLRDRCHACLHPVEPHRSVATDMKLVYCSTCGVDLRRGGVQSVDAEAMEFQRRADQALATGTAAWGGSEQACTQWFDTARNAVAQTQAQMRQNTGTRVDQKSTRLGFELMGPAERASKLVHAGRVLEQPGGRSGSADREVTKRPVPSSRRRSPKLNSVRGGASGPVAMHPQTKSAVMRDWMRLRRRLRLGMA